MKNCIMLLTLAVMLTPLSVAGQAQRQPAMRHIAPEVSGSHSFHSDLIFQQAGQKSPVVAGILSFLIPGTGSYYAGYASHGTRHLLIGMGSAGVFVLGVAKSLENCFLDLFDPCTAEEQDRADRWAIVAMLGAVAYGTNWVWGIVTATQDANAYNRAVTAGGGGMASWIKPDVTVLTSTPTAFSTLAPRADSRLGFRVGRIVF